MMPRNSPTGSRMVRCCSVVSPTSASTMRPDSAACAAWPSIRASWLDSRIMSSTAVTAVKVTAASRNR